MSAMIELIGVKATQAIELIGQAGVEQDIQATGTVAPRGPAGRDGLGVPVGGSEGQVLAKVSLLDNDTEWKTLTADDVGGVAKDELVYNVKDHGALGDGATDDTSAIQDTIDLAFSHGGGKVVFPPATYVVSEAVLIPSNIHMIGIGECIIFLQDDSDSDVFQTAHYLKTDPERNENITIEGFTINGNKNGQSTDPPVAPYSSMNSLAGIRIVKTDSFTVTNCYSYDCIGYGIEVKSSTNGRVLGCKFTGSGDDGLSVSDGSHPDSTAHIVIDSCTSDNNGEIFTAAGCSGFELDDGPDDVTFINCRASGNHGRGFEIHSHPGNANTISRIKYIGCYAYANNTPEGFPFRRSSGFDIDFLQSPALGFDISYVDCHSYGHNNREFRLHASSDSATPTATRVSIIGCTALYSNTGPVDGDVTQRAVIEVSGINELFIRQNIIEGTTDTFGIVGYSYNDNVTIEDNDFSGCYAAISLLANGNCYIKDNRIKSPSPRSVASSSVGSIFVQNADEIYVDGNTVFVDTTSNDSGLSTGFSLPIDKAWVTNNRFIAVPSGTPVTSRGIYVQIAPGDIRDNFVSGFTYGINSSSTSSVIMNNDVSGSTNAFQSLSSLAKTFANVTSTGVGIDGGSA